MNSGYPKLAQKKEEKTNTQRLKSSITEYSRKENEDPATVVERTVKKILYRATSKGAQAQALQNLLYCQSFLPFS